MDQIYQDLKAVAARIQDAELNKITERMHNLMHAPLDPEIRAAAERIKKEKLDAEVKRRVDRFMQTQIDNKLPNSYHWFPRTSGQLYLARVHEEQRRLAAERYIRRQLTKRTPFQKACDTIRAENPAITDKDLYIRARMRLKVEACRPGLAAIAKETPFQVACGKALVADPTLSGEALWAAARAILSAK